MNKYFLWALMFFSSGISTYAQNWVQKANYTGGPIDLGAVSFSLGGRGYVINYLISYNDVREYDPVTNSWTSKANFPGTARAYATGFTIGTKGYYGTGSDINGFYKDFWEYNSLTDTWVQKRDFPGVARSMANAFAIGNKGYLGIGWAGNYYHLIDLWEYNPLSDTWVQKRDFPGIKRIRSAGFSIMNKGYITSGQDTTSAYLYDLWEYNPASNSWVRKADLLASGRMLPIGIGIGDKGYVGLGSTSGYFNDFWEYNPSNNTWTQLANFGGAARWKAISFVIGLKMFVGAGQGSGGTYYYDIWEYTQPCSTAVVTSLNSNTTKCVGEFYQFNNNITGSTPYNCQWYKDNVAILGATSQSYTINNFKLSDSGSYTCIVANLCSSDTSTPIKLSIIPLPVADFTVSDTAMCFKGNVFNFANHSTVKSGTLSYYWTFGDGATYSKQDTTHSYLAPDTFFVKLKASLRSTCYKENTKRIIVYPQPEIHFSVNDSIQCLKGNNFIFNNNSAIQWGTLNYKWNFGDGANSAITNPVHTYLKEGPFSAVLKAISDRGCSDSISKPVSVLTSPVADFDVQDTAQCLNNSFVFLNKSHISGGSIVQNNWKFGDGKTAVSFNGSHSYLKEGSYAVSLSATSNLGCMDSISKNIRAYPQPVASFTVNDTGQCLLNNSFSFANTSTISSGSLNTLWKLSDGANSTLKNYIHSFAVSGMYTVKLLTASDHNCKDSLSKMIRVYPMPDADLTVNDTVQCLLNNSFSFTNTSTISSGTLNTLWKLSDGANSTLKNYLHSFSGSGMYTVKLLTASDHNCKDSLLQKLYINDNPVVNLGKDTTLTDKQNITLDAGSGMNDYLWSDGSTNRQLKIDTTGYGLGNHIIWVKVTKNGCTDEDSVTITFEKAKGIAGSAFTGMKLYPNPFSSKIYLEIPTSSQEVKVRIVNVLGSEVYNTMINSTAGSSKTEIDLSWLTKGLYNLEISEQGFKRIEKVVKE
jgi:PKD repeat protein